MQLSNSNQVCKIDMTWSFIYFIFKEKSYIIQFISTPNQFDSLNMSMVPDIDILTDKLDIGNSKKKQINIHDIFSGNKIKCDLCEPSASKRNVVNCDTVCISQTALKKHSKTLDFKSHIISEPNLKEDIHVCNQFSAV